MSSFSTIIINAKELDNTKALLEQMTQEVQWLEQRLDNQLTITSPMEKMVLNDYRDGEELLEQQLEHERVSREAGIIQQRLEQERAAKAAELNRQLQENVLQCSRNLIYPTNC